MLVMGAFSLLMAQFYLLFGIVVRNAATANVIASGCTLFFMLMGGLLINIKSMMPSIEWLQFLSLFRFPFEALAVNEATNIVFTD
jgi:hypothetical protein